MADRLLDTDVLIAATALCHNLVLVTTNVRHFPEPGLEVEPFFGSFSPQRQRAQKFSEVSEGFSVLSVSLGCYFTPSHTV